MSDQAYSAIGKVVVNSQYFEVAFTLLCKLALKNKHAASIGEIKPLSISTSFKQATSAILKDLKYTVQLDPEFESKMDSLIERRHTLIHRWLLNHGWPMDPDSTNWSEVAQFADQLSADLNSMSRVLIVALQDWASRFPELANTVDATWLASLPTEFQVFQTPQPE